MDGTAFFRSLVGKTNPRAELEATLRGFFDARPVADELSDAQCRFPARLAFLARRLALDPARPPARPCPRQEAFVSRVAARSVTLVFSSYYLDNPVSAFGHTLLRLNKTEGARPEGAFELLDYGVNYAATPDGSTGLVYGLKGLFGFFQGRFSHHAYYYKVREYSDAESRDLWEYDLALAPEEVALLVAHLWELGATWFDYFYLDENCSYHVLGALEAAAPRLDLLSHAGRYVVLPSDTVKALFASPGLVRAVHFRPSIRSQFEARLSLLDAPARSFLLALERDPAAAFPAGLADTARAAAIDAAVDLVDLQFFRKVEVGASPEVARMRQLLLQRRSALRVISPPLTVPEPDEGAPHLGHGSTRLGAGGGWSRRDGAFAALDLRIALHDLADPPEGYPPLAQIEFLPTRLRVGRAGRVELDESWLIRVQSLNDLSRFHPRPSWRLEAGAAAVRDGGCAGCVAGQAEAGAGVAADLLGVVDGYVGLDSSLEWAPDLSGLAGRQIRPGIGPGALLRFKVGKRLALLGDARWRALPGASPRETFDLRGQLRVHLAPGLSVALEARRTPTADEVAAVALGYF